MSRYEFSNRINYNTVLCGHRFADTLISLIAKFNEKIVLVVSKGFTFMLFKFNSNLPHCILPFFCWILLITVCFILVFSQGQVCWNWGLNMYYRGGLTIIRHRRGLLITQIPSRQHGVSSYNKKTINIKWTVTDFGKIELLPYKKTHGWQNNSGINNQWSQFMPSMKPA